MISVKFCPPSFGDSSTVFPSLGFQLCVRILLPLGWWSVSSALSILASVFIVMINWIAFFVYQLINDSCTDPEYKLLAWFWTLLIIRLHLPFVSCFSAPESNLYFLIGPFVFFLRGTYSLIFNFHLLNVMCWTLCWMLLTLHVLLLLAGDNFFFSRIILFLSISKLQIVSFYAFWRFLDSAVVVWPISDFSIHRLRDIIFNYV